MSGHTRDADFLYDQITGQLLGYVDQQGNERSFGQPTITVVPASPALDRANVQRAADMAMANGYDLQLAAGTFDFTAGGVVADRGPDLAKGGVSGLAYAALKIRGAGQNKTKVIIGAAQKGFFFADADGAGVGIGGAVEDLSIEGPGIGSGAIGIQFGGRSTTRSDLLLQMSIRRIGMDNVTSCVIADDVSGLEIDTFRFLRYKYGFEWGYNVDDVEVKAMLNGADEAFIVGQAMTVSSGSNVVTAVPAFVIAKLQVGYAVTVPGAFPPGAYVGSISAASFTVVNFNGVAVPATANAGTVWFSIGRLFNFGARVLPTAGSLYPSQSSSFVSPFWSTLYPAERGRVSCNNHHYVGLANDQELILDMGGGSHFNVDFQLYAERFARVAVLGDAASNQQAFNITFTKCYLGQNQTVVGAPFLILAAAMGFGLSIKGCYSDSAAIAYPWVRCDGFYNYAAFEWELNNLASTLPGQVQFGDANPAQACVPFIRYGGAMYMNSARAGDAIQPYNGGTWFYYGQDGMTAPLAAGSITLNNPATYNQGGIGKVFTIYLTAQGANTMTLGTVFKKVDGTNVGVIAAGTTGQKMAYRFVFDGTNFLAQNAPAWVT